MLTIGLEKIAKAQSHHKIIIAGVLVLSLVATFAFKTLDVISASFSFTQTSWSGGADTTSVPIHPTNQTGWTKYFSSTNLDFIGGTPRLTSSTHSSTDDGTFVTDGVTSSTNGGFYNGSFSATAATSTGLNASITLNGTTTVINAPTTLTSMPAAAGDGFDIIRNGTEDYIYVAKGDNGAFYRYSLTSNSWTTLSSMPGLAYNLIRADEEDYIYATQGYSNGFQRYSIAGNSWTTMATVPASVYSSSFTAREGNYIYVAAGNGTTGFYRYSISGNTWSTMTAVPAAVNDGRFAIHAAGEDYIYVFSGGSTGFYRYSITGNSWTTLTAAPTATGFGASMTRNGTDNTIYFVPGANTAKFYSYSISGNSWTTLADVPSGIYQVKNSLVRSGSSDNIFAYGATFGTGLFRYSIGANTWTSMTAPGTATGWGGKILQNSTEMAMYIAPGESTAFYKFTISNTQYATSGIYTIYGSSGSFTSAALNLGAASYSTMTWTSTTPSQVGPNALIFQVATSSNNSTWSSFTGPTGTASYYLSSPANIANIGGSKYFKYRAYFGTTNTIYTPTLNDVTVNYNSHTASGTLISSIFDTADDTNVLANIRWNPASLPSGTTIRFQLRSGSTTSSVASATWMGPSGNSSDYFTTSNDNAASIPNALRTGNDDKLIQYKAFFDTPNGSLTPVLASTTLTYVVNASPEVQHASSTQNSDGSVTISYEVRDLDTTTGSSIAGFVAPSFKYWNGTTYVDVTTLSANATSTKVVNDDGVTWTAYSLTWYPHIDFANQNTTTAKIRITIDDREAANNTVVTTTPNFSLDTTPPTGSSILVSASSTPARVTLNATDSAAIEYKLSQNSDLAGASFTAFTTDTTFSLSSDPATLYVQFKDAYSNTTSIVSVTTPETPSSTVIQDVSNINVSPSEYRLFIAWRTVAAPTPGFGTYRVYRSTNQTTWTPIGSLSDRTVNYYMDATVAADTLYYYRVTTIDTNGNTSFNSAVVSGKANGIQDAGEGGGGNASAPVISNVTTSLITPSQTTVTWDTDSLSDSKISYSTSPGIFTDSTTVLSLVDNSSGVGNHNVILSNLQANTTYYYSVSSMNSTNSSTVDTNGGNGYTFTTLASPIITSPPTVEANSNSTTTISWETNTAADSYVFYSTSSNFVVATTASDDSYVTSHSVTFGGLTPGTKYYYYIRTRESGGNTEYDKNINNGVIQYYTLTTPNDQTAPTFSGFTTNGSTTTVNIIWTTNEKSNSQVYYGETEAYGTFSSTDETLTTRHIITISGLTPSTTYHYSVRSSDANNNAGQSSDQTFTTPGAPDVTAPTISNVTTSSIALNRATISWTTNELSNGTVNFGTTPEFGSLAGSLYDYTSSTHSVTLTGLNGNTLYYFKVNSADATGNTTAGSELTFTTVPDITAPVITNSSTLVNDTAAFINWTTDEQAVAEINYGPTADLGTSIIATSTYDLNHSLPLTGLINQTIYYYRIISADPSANTSTSDIFTLTTAKFGDSTRPTSAGNNTAAPPDTTAPILSKIIIKDTTPFSVTVEWGTDKEGSSLVRFGKTTSYGSLDGDELTQTTQHSVVLNNLFPGTTYHFKAESFDSKGNMGASEDSTFVTANTDGSIPSSTPAVELPAQNDLLAQITFAPQTLISQIVDALLKNPYLKDVSQSSFEKALTEMANKVVDAPSIVGTKPQVEVHGTSATIRWSTDKKSTSAVAYATAEDYKPNAVEAYTNAAVNPDQIATNHEVELIGLKPSTLYHFTVMSKGTIGPEGRSADFTFNSTSELPEIKDITIAKVDESSVTVNWRTSVPAEANIEYTNLVNNKIYSQSDGVLLVNHSAVINNLESGSNYQLVLKAKGELGAVGESLPFKFSTTVDKNPPKITNLSSNSTLYPGKESKVQTIFNWETDEPASSQIFFQEGINNSASSTQSSLLDGVLTQKHIMVITSFRAGTVYKYWVESRDPAGNVSKSEIFSVLTPIEKKTIIDIIGSNFQSVFGWTKNLKVGN